MHTTGRSLLWFTGLWELVRICSGLDELKLVSRYCGGEAYSCLFLVCLVLKYLKIEGGSVVRRFGRWKALGKLYRFGSQGKTRVVQLLEYWGIECIRRAVYLRHPEENDGGSEVAFSFRDLTYFFI